MGEERDGGEEVVASERNLEDEVQSKRVGSVQQKHTKVELNCVSVFPKLSQVKIREIVRTRELGGKLISESGTHVSSCRLRPSSNACYHDLPEAPTDLSRSRCCSSLAVRRTLSRDLRFGQQRLPQTFQPSEKKDLSKRVGPKEVAVLYLLRLP